MDAQGLYRCEERLPAPSVQTLGASPASVTAARDGVLVISAGAVSLIEYGRGAAFVGLGVLAGAVPVRRGDIIRITYTVAPTVTLI